MGGTVATRLAFCGALAVLCTGCVSESGRPSTALWTSVKKKGEVDEKPLKHPVATNVAFGKMAEKRGKRDDARRLYETALSHDAKSVDAVLGIARLDEYAGRTADAERNYEKALGLDPRNAQALTSFGMFYASQKRWNEAIPRLQAAVAAEPNSADCRYNLGLVLANSGNATDAVPLLAAKVGEPHAYFETAFILNQQGRKAEAVHHLQIALAKKPDLEPAYRMLAHLQNAGNPNSGRRGVSDERRPYGSQDSGNIRSVSHMTPNLATQLPAPPDNNDGDDVGRRPVTIGRPTMISER